MKTVELTHEELAALRQWLKAIGFQGTAEQLRGALALHESITLKLEKAAEDGRPGDDHDQ